MAIKKIIYQQDAALKISPRLSGETSINISGEIAELLGGVNGSVTFILHKDDYVNALSNILALLPLYKTTSQKAEKVTFTKDYVLKRIDNIESFFGSNEDKQYKVNLLCRKDGRYYLNELKDDSGFNIRNYLVEDHSQLVFDKQGSSIIVNLTSFYSKISEVVSDNIEYESTPITEFYPNYLSAIRTKPFLLLAGISGTGKSRIVKELAYSSCPNVGELRSDPTSPGNYCLVEVKPNWNDSTELLGYETVLEGGGYHLTKFVKFIIKAMQYEDVPFFVCLDEMNLAPVEQYFAEFLSVLESRKDVVKDGKNTIQSEPLIDATIFRKYKHKLHAELFSTDKEEVSIGYSCPMSDEETPIYFNEVYTRLMDEGLRIPQNLIVVGTVNMDDTTYQFSRKVIDRAMTIEMNEVNLDNMFDSNKADTLNYPDEVVDKDWFFAPYAQSDKALSMIEEEERIQLINKIKEVIGQTDVTGTVTPNSLEVILGKTPFRIAYRVVNELVLHFYALRWQDKDASFDELFKIAFDNILMMKVLPRIEGNEDLVKNPLSALMDWTSGLYPRSNQKIIEMKNRLDIQHFTSFWP